DEMPGAAPAVERVHEWAGALELLELLDARARALVEDVLRDAVRERHADHVGLAMRPEAEMSRKESYRPCDVELARLHLDQAADPGAVDLARAGGEPLDRHVQPRIRIPALIQEDARLAAGDEDEVEVAVAVHVAGEERLDARDRR